MNLLEEYKTKIYIILNNYKLIKEYKKIQNQIIQILKINNIEPTIDDQNDVLFTFNKKYWAFELSTRQNHIILLENPTNTKNDWDIRIRNLVDGFKYLDLTIPDDLIEKFLYELY